MTWLLLWLAVQQPVAHYRHRAGWVLPDSLVTPGAVRETVAAKICGVSTTAFRHTTEHTKQLVYAAYGIAHHRRGEFEIDHLIPLELGGKDTITNLWPQPAMPEPGFHTKDRLENVARSYICSGALSPDSAQRWIARDFPSMYDSLMRR